MECLWRLAYRKRTASPLSAKSPDGKLGRWPWLTLVVSRGNISMRHASVSGQETPKTAKLAFIRMYGVSQGQWTRMTFGGQYMQSQRSRRVMCWPKSCIISPLLLMAATYVSLYTISLKNRSEAYDVIARWPDLTRSFFCLKLHKGCPISYAKFYRDPPSDSAAMSEKNSWVVHHPPPCTGEG